MSELHRPAATVRAELARRGIKHITLAAHLGYSQPAMSRRLKGEIDFSASDLVAIAALLDVPASTLLGEDVAA